MSALRAQLLDELEAARDAACRMEAGEAERARLHDAIRAWTIYNQGVVAALSDAPLALSQRVMLGTALKAVSACSEVSA